MNERLHIVCRLFLGYSMEPFSEIDDLSNPATSAKSPISRQLITLIVAPAVSNDLETNLELSTATKRARVNESNR